MKNLLIIILLFSAKSYGQTLYVPNNPDSIKHVVNVNGAVRTSYNVDLIKNKADKSATISINGNTQTLGSNPSFTVSGGGVSSKVFDSLNYFNVTNYGANGQDTLDDQTAIQAAINACFSAGGGTVYFPNGVYYLKGALNSTTNSQLYIPLTAQGDPKVSIRILGQSMTSFEQQVLTDITPPTNGVVLFSRITGTGATPSILGSYPNAATGLFGFFNYTTVFLENLCFRAKSVNAGVDFANSICGVNFLNITQVKLDNIRVDIESHLINSANPAGSGSVGIIMPKVNNHALLEIGTVQISGYETGMTIEEHTNANEIITAGCVYGIDLKQAYHASSIMSYLSEGCNSAVKVSAAHPLNIFSLKIEHYINENGVKWFAYTKDIYSTVAGSASNAFIHIFNTRILAGGGPVSTFVSDYAHTKVYSSNDTLATGQVMVANTTNKMFDGNNVQLGWSFSTNTFSINPGNINLSGNTSSTGTITLNSPASNSYDANVIKLGATNQTGGFIFGSTGAITTSSGPFVAGRGNTFSSAANQRGNLFLGAGAPSSPNSSEGSIQFFTGPGDPVRLKIDNTGISTFYGSIITRSGTTSIPPLTIPTNSILMTTPTAGAFETDGTDLYWTNSAGVRKKVTLQ